MLKFARNRSNSAERKVYLQSPPRTLNTSHTRDFNSAAAATKETPLSSLLPRGRSSSLERPVLRSRRQLSFDRDVTPRMISAQRRSAKPLPCPPSTQDLSPPPPPVVRRAAKPPGPPGPPQHQATSSVEGDYTEVSSTAFCRLKSATLAPLTPTLEKLSSAHISEGVRPILPPKSALKNSNKYDFHRAVERLVEKLDLHLLDTSSESGYGSDDHESSSKCSSSDPPPLPLRRHRRMRRVHFDSYVLLLQGVRERNLELVQTNVREVCSEALATEELLLEFMRAVVDGAELIAAELLAHGVDPNVADPSGLTPLHLAAAANALPVVKVLLSAGAAVFSRAHSSGKTPSELCAPALPGFQACHAYLRCMEECLGVANEGRVFVARQYRTCRTDELCVRPGEALAVVRKGDYEGSAWWWCSNEGGEEGYVLKDLLSLHKPCLW